jgi:cyclophilin family peptidyl-prolyl cis-trans isomerase/HEAT repeat protein
MPNAECGSVIPDHRRLILALAVATAVAFGIRPSAFGIDSDRIYRVLVAEDSRSDDPAAVQVVLDALGAPDPQTRRIAVRALGRLERAALADRIVPLLQDADAGVRREAANALGQSFFSTAGADVGAPAASLTARLQTESDAAVRAAILQTLGRLDYPAEEAVRAAERVILRHVWYDPSGSSIRLDPSGSSASRRSIEELDGAVRGLSRLFARRPNAARIPAPDTVNALSATVLRTFPTVGAAMEAERYARVRRLALQTLGSSSTLDEKTSSAAAGDRDWQVRRLAVLHGRTLPGGDARVMAALKDPAPQVRFEALRALGQTAKIPCPDVLALVSDSDPHVARRAAATLTQPCDDGTSAGLERLGRLAAGGAQYSERLWPLASTALGSLSAACTRAEQTAPRPAVCTRAADLVHEHARSRIWQVRMYAAAAAGGFKDMATLRRLAQDSHPNVREAAIARLGAESPRKNDDLIIDALKADDYQLVMNAAKLLDGSSHPDAVPALKAAFDRLSAKRSDTAHDPLTTIRDALKARGVEVVLPSATPTEPPFTQTELEELLRREPRAIVTMASGRSFELALLAEEAPATVARFVRLARRGVYNGLTFHRVEPNFVIQGGSPGANEYAGHDPYMRDEVGLVSHDRGTVGISTRGHDTGDAQIFINLVDNPRLDHRYTVFAKVVRGMEVVDSVIEGDALAQIVIRLQN